MLHLSDQFILPEAERLKEAVGKRTNGPDDEFSQGAGFHRLWADCSSSWGAGLTSPQATEGWISFSSQKRPKWIFMKSQALAFFAWVTGCMFTLGGNGKEEVVLGVLPHQCREWLEAKLDTSLVVCLCLHFQCLCYTCSEVVRAMSVSKSFSAIIYHSTYLAFRC